MSSGSTPASSTRPLLVMWLNVKSGSRRSIFSISLSSDMMSLSLASAASNLSSAPEYVFMIAAAAATAAFENAVPAASFYPLS